MTPDEQRAVKEILTELAGATPQLTLALNQTTLLVELVAWTHVLSDMAKRLDALNLPFEEQATTTVTPNSNNPGALIFRNLADFRAPDDLSQLWESR